MCYVALEVFSQSLFSTIEIHSDTNGKIEAYYIQLERAWSLLYSMVTYNIKNQLALEACSSSHLHRKNVGGDCNLKEV